VTKDHVFSSTPTDRVLYGDGIRMHALDWGEAPGGTILFLHGGGLNGHTWDVVCDLLRPDFRCIALDLRGHGDSDWAPDGDYRLQAHIRDIRHVIGSVAAAPLVLVGMSLGGLVGLAAAADDYVAARALVIIDTGPDGSRTAGRRRLHAFMSGPDEFESIDELIDRAMSFNPRRDRERLRRSLANNLRRTERGTWTWKYDPRFRSPFDEREVGPEEVIRRFAERRELLLDAAARVTCPVLVVRGGESDMFLDEDAERTAALFSRASWVRIDGASHTVQSDRPYELASTIRAFITSTIR
jgi:pimeloyl-ACP methyl ester carboxylesterase